MQRDQTEDGDTIEKTRIIVVRNLGVMSFNVYITRYSLLKMTTLGQRIDFECTVLRIT